MSVTLCEEHLLVNPCARCQLEDVRKELDAAISDLREVEEEKARLRDRLSKALIPFFNVGDKVLVDMGAKQVGGSVLSRWITYRVNPDDGTAGPIQVPEHMIHPEPPRCEHLDPHGRTYAEFYQYPFCPGCGENLGVES